MHLLAYEVFDSCWLLGLFRLTGVFFLRIVSLVVYVTL